MDVLPVQASAVACERVFSSSKETCTLRRSRILPKLMEALQMLKYSVKYRRLAFHDDLIAKECDYTLEGLTDNAITELYEAGKLVELNELVANTYANSAT